MLKNEFMQAISIDLAPYGYDCEWCGQPAEHELTVLGGSFHNESSCFCRLCGEEFARAVAYSLKAEEEAKTKAEHLVLVEH